MQLTNETQDVNRQFEERKIHQPELLIIDENSESTVKAPSMVPCLPVEYFNASNQPLGVPSGDLRTERSFNFSGDAKLKDVYASALVQGRQLS